MKIAIVCDWLVTAAGSEKVLYHIIQSFKDADLFAVIDFLPPHDRHLIHHKPITTTFLQHVPFIKKRYRSFLPLMPLAIEQLDVSAYDVIISNSHAVAKGILTGPNQLHISYVHSPMRYAWDLQHQYLHEAGLTRGLKGYLAKRMLHRLRIWDQRTANSVDHFLANSNFIAKRIWKTYRRESTVIYPPVDLTQFKPGQQKDDFYLAASRLVPYKKMSLIAETFASLPDKQLIIIGDGPELKKIKRLATHNISVLGFQPTEVLIDYLQRAKAFIFAAEEDFGLMPIEAQACGTPVIAFGKGGALETIRGLDHDNPSGLFFHEQTKASLSEAILNFEANKTQFKKEHCMESAARFSLIRFQDSFKTFVLKQAAQFK